MDSTQSSVKELIFHTHLHKLQELMSKYVGGDISKEEWHELLQFNEECIEMMGHMIMDTNKLLENSSLISEDEAINLNNVLQEGIKKLKSRNNNMKDYLD
ncbi:hypothetical protein MOD24_16980 [Bacillus haynesii]|uniref:hypothetical protein n=1 Tax=Bacillus haynesii TaxID=1925021 RepID=UPI00227FCC78|nr:hypothetical protein [Bacillus haynesii]MCY8577540.1 hypothetical protein [Bacillus haynesii]MEC1657113.1 hypothetical protein [Bacillus haynesii]